MREVDYLIIGAGIAGMTLWDRLRDQDVVLLDPSPGRYKVGESVVPQHFFPHETRGLLERARRLRSASDKLGTLFVTDDSVSFFHAYFDAHFALHVERSELEQMYAEAWNVCVTPERVESVDVDRREVRGSVETYRVRRQILDCSGPAMVLARRLGSAYELWPVHAAWAYWDVESANDARFWEELRESGRAFHRYDDVSRCVAPSTVDDALMPSRMTMLTRFDDGIWVWQIPLRQAGLLSLGVVSRHAPLGRDEYLDIARRALGAHWVAQPRLGDRNETDPYRRFHARNRFAWAARQFSAPGWALVGDAAFFGDPIFSVGTAVATNQALRVARLLPEWERGGQQLYERTTQELFERAARAYEHWYRGQVTTDAAVAEEVQADFLNGLAFHVRTGEHYLDMWRVAEPDDPGADPNACGDRGRDVTELAAVAFQLPDVVLAQARSGSSGLFLEWRLGNVPFVVEVALRAESHRAYRVVGPFALSYRGTLGRDEQRLLEQLAEVLGQRQREVLDLLES